MCMLTEEALMLAACSTPYLRPMQLNLTHWNLYASLHFSSL